MARSYEGKPAQLHVWRLKKVLEQHRSVPITGSFSAPMLPSMFVHRKRPESYRATQRAFQRFLLERGAITVTAKPDRFADLLSDYRRHLTELRGLAISTTVALHVNLDKAVRLRKETSTAQAAWVNRC